VRTCSPSSVSSSGAPTTLFQIYPRFGPLHQEHLYLSCLRRNSLCIASIFLNFWASVPALFFSQSELDKGIVTASAGNHAQGVAFSAKHLGCMATIVMPIVTPEIKVGAHSSSNTASLPFHPRLPQDNTDATVPCALLRCLRCVAWVPKLFSLETPSTRRRNMP